MSKKNIEITPFEWYFKSAPRRNKHPFDYSRKPLRIKGWIETRAPLEVHNVIDVLFLVDEGDVQVMRGMTVTGITMREGGLFTCNLEKRFGKPD